MLTETPEHSNPLRLWKIALVPVLLTFTAYLSIMNNGFVWDDENVIRDNTYIRFLDGQSLRWMFTTFFWGNWIPLHWLSLALDYQMGGLDPRIYHFTNLLLHSLNTGLVFFLAWRTLDLVVRKNLSALEADFRTSGAFLAALLFGLHPLHVESAAWGAERKDLLCAFFFLSALWVYLDYAAGIGSRKVKYLACLGLFLLALMSKPMAVTLPLVLLLLDFWPLGRWETGRPGVLKEKIPFLVFSLLTGLLALSAQAQAGALPNLEKMPADFRVLNAVHSVVFYLEKILVPRDLAAFYPLPPGMKVWTAAHLGALVLAAAISLACYLKRREWPGLLAAWAFYLITLAPVSGIFQIGSQAAADRYTYLPSLGPFLLFSGVAARALFKRRALFYQLAAGLGAVLWVATILQAGTWKNSITLWEQVAAVSPNVSGMAYTNLASAYQKAEMWDESLRTYITAISLGPNLPEAREGKGLVLLHKGMLDQAAQEFKTEISLKPQSAPAHRYLSMAYQRMGNKEGALAEAREGVRLAPGEAESYSVLGGACFLAVQPDQAAQAFQKAMELDPENDTHLFNLATAYMSGNRYYEAALALQKAAAVKTQDPAIYEKLAEVFEKSGRKDLAAISAERARILAGKHF